MPTGIAAPTSARAAAWWMRLALGPVLLALADEAQRLLDAAVEEAVDPWDAD